MPTGIRLIVPAGFAASATTLGAGWSGIAKMPAVVSASRSDLALRRFAASRAAASRPAAATPGFVPAERDVETCTTAVAGTRDADGGDEGEGYGSGRTRDGGGAGSGVRAVLPDAYAVLPQARTTTASATLTIDTAGGRSNDELPAPTTRLPFVASTPLSAAREGYEGWYQPHN